MIRDITAEMTLGGKPVRAQSGFFESGLFLRESLFSKGVASSAFRLLTGLKLDLPFPVCCRQAATSLGRQAYFMAQESMEVLRSNHRVRIIRIFLFLFWARNE